MTFKRIRYVAVFLALAWLPACGESFDDAIARAESGAVTMDRRERQTVIDTLRKGLEEQEELSVAAKGRATAWLGHLLVRHGQYEAAQAVLSDFGATADQLVAAGDPVSAVRGLGALGAALVGVRRDFDAVAPLDRAATVAAAHDLGTHPVVIEVRSEMAFLTIVPGVVAHDTRGAAIAAAEELLTQGAEIAQAEGGEDDPRLGRIDFVRANLLAYGTEADTGLDDAARRAVNADILAHLERARARLGDDHPTQVPVLEWLAQEAAGRCDTRSVKRLSQEAIAVAEEIYGDTAERTFEARSAHGELLMAMGDMTRGRQIVLDARAARYGKAAGELQAPASPYDPLGCIDPPG